jgi:hypothetical protein
MLRESTEDDVVAVTALSQRPEIFRYLIERGGASAGPDRVKMLVKRAR